MRIFKLFGKNVSKVRIKIQVCLIDGKKIVDSKGMTVYVSGKRDYEEFVSKLIETLKKWYGTPF